MYFERTLVKKQLNYIEYHQAMPPSFLWEKIRLDKFLYQLGVLHYPYQSKVYFVDHRFNQA